MLSSPVITLGFVLVVTSCCVIGQEEAEAHHGLSLQLKIMKLSEFTFSHASSLLKVVESLINVINQQRALHTMSDSMDGALITTFSAALTAVSNDACSYLTDILSDWYQGFDCTEEHLTKVAANIIIFTATRDAQLAAYELLSSKNTNINGVFDDQNQCTFWNSRVLRNGSTTVNDKNAFCSVQKTVLQNIYLAGCIDSNLCLPM